VSLQRAIIEDKQRIKPITQNRSLRETIGTPNKTHKSEKLETITMMKVF
jgi:hypothetical protein